jgi:hypothetical protein
VFPARSPHQIDRIGRWLTTIAGHLNKHRIYDLAWWHLRTIASPTGLGTLAAAVSGGCISAVLYVGLPQTDTETGMAVFAVGLGAFIAFGVFLRNGRIWSRRTPTRTSASARSSSGGAAGGGIGIWVTRRIGTPTGKPFPHGSSPATT